MAAAPRFRKPKVDLQKVHALMEDLQGRYGVRFEIKETYTHTNAGDGHEHFVVPSPELMQREPEIAQALQDHGEAMLLLLAVNKDPQAIKTLESVRYDRNRWMLAEQSTERMTDEGDADS